MDLDQLRHRALDLGVEPSYWDNEGEHHDCDPEAIARVVDIVEADCAGIGSRRLAPVVLGAPPHLAVGSGIRQAHLTLADGTLLELKVIDERIEFDDPLPVGSHRLSLDGVGVDEFTTIVVAPDRMPRSGRLAGRAGLFAPAYALWEEASPLPSFEHLRALSAMLPSLDVDLLVTLPLYAGFLDEPFDPSPYAPVSRLHWNEVYIDDASLPTAPIPPIGDLVDWRALARRRRGQLLEAAAGLVAGRQPDLAAHVDTWVGQHPDVADYARFRATVHPEPIDGTHPLPVVDTSHRLAQFLADEQLRRLETENSAAFALDLPIGSHPAGYETWAHPDLWAPGMTVGAPPDMLFAGGQDWGFPPQLPGAAQRSGYELWRRIVSRCGHHASMLRIDHVLGVHRLWWIPDGMGARSGVYVRYPRQEIMSVIAAEAEAANTTVVGEDLGTVPREMIDLLAEWDTLGLFAEEMHVFDAELREIPRRSVASLRTHDMPAFAELGEDTERAGGMERYRQNLEQALGRPVADTPSAMLDAAFARLADSHAYMVIADLDDLLGETAAHNVPGQVLPTTWRRRLARPTSTTMADPGVRSHLRTLTARPMNGAT